MSNGVSQDNDSPHAADDFYKVSDDSAGRVLIDCVRCSLISVKIRSADKYNDKTRSLLQQHITSFPPRDKEAIRVQFSQLASNSHMTCDVCVTKIRWHRVMGTEEKLENTRSPFRRFLLGMEYQRVSKQTYLIVKVGPYRAEVVSP
jgi:hypothetical protein